MQVQSNVKLSGRQGIYLGLFVGGIFACCGLVSMLPALASRQWVGVLVGGVFFLVGMGFLGYAATAYYGRVRIGSPQLTISNTNLRVGETFNVNLLHTFQRDVQLEKILIQLLFRETATYQQGTDTRTVTHNDIIENYELPGGQYQAGQMIQQAYTMQIPPDGMHTVKVRRNQLQWFVRLEAGIPKLPDYVEEYELAVLPEMAEMGN
jgi:hypothetical protein